MTSHRTETVSQELSPTKFDGMCDQPRVFGKAQAYPRAFRSKKVKSIVDEAKQQKRTNAQIEAAPGFLDLDSQQSEENLSADAAKSIKKVGKHCVLPKGKPALELLDEHGNYIPKKGRIPYVDPFSEGFMSLPAKVKEFSLQCYAKDNELKIAFLEAIRDIKELTSLARYKAYLSLKERFTEIPKGRILQACGIDPSRDKELADSINKPDPYAEMRLLIVEIFQAYDGKAGQITIAQELRKFGVYLCEQTVRKLMQHIYKE